MLKSQGDGNRFVTDLFGRFAFSAKDGRNTWVMTLFCRKDGKRRRNQGENLFGQAITSMHPMLACTPGVGSGEGLSGISRRGGSGEGSTGFLKLCSSWTLLTSWSPLTLQQPPSSLSSYPNPSSRPPRSAKCQQLRPDRQTDSHLAVPGHHIEGEIRNSGLVEDKLQVRIRHHN